MSLFRLSYALLICFISSCNAGNDEIVIVPDDPIEIPQEKEEKEENEEEENEEEEEEENQEPTLSACSPTNNILFDVPVNNSIKEVNRKSYGMESWQLINELSDEFNYSGGKSATNFMNKWKLGFVNNYTGPIPTIWTGDQISFETLDGSNRALVLAASETGTGANKRLKCGMISSKAKSSYPIFQEAKVKISNSQLANAIWMLSGESGTTEEIDNLEAYGPRIRPNNTQCDNPYYADRIHLSHHIFKNDNGTRLDYQPKKQTWMSRKITAGNCYRDNDVVWSEDYHYFGVKWVNEEHLDYFIDGKLVKTVKGLNQADGIDPNSYAKCNGLTREMHMIISQAAQAWRYGGASNFWNSSDIKSGTNTKMYVDWIRVYSPNGTINNRSCN